MGKSTATRTCAFASMLLAGAWLATYPAAAAAAGTPAAPSNPYDPCLLVTAADLQATLSTSFKAPDSSDNGDARICQYESTREKYIVSLYTNNKEAVEFQAESAKAASEGHYAPFSIGGAPAYKLAFMGRLVVWKNRVSITVDIGDVSMTSTPEALEAAREKLAALALSRMH
jgi:hypothetical protein